MIFQTEFSSSRVRPFLKSAVEPMDTDAPRLTCVLSREPGATKEEDATANDNMLRAAPSRSRKVRFAGRWYPPNTSSWEHDQQILPACTCTCNMHMHMHMMPSAGPRATLTTPR